MAANRPFTEQEKDDVRLLRDIHPNRPQRELARLIVNLPNSTPRRRLAQRGFWGVYGAIRRYDAEQKRAREIREHQQATVGA